MTQAVEQIQKYMDALGWSQTTLHRQTHISLQNIRDIMSGAKQPTHIQVMIIVNKITKQYPEDMHWDIYHSIVVQPAMSEARNK